MTYTTDDDTQENEISVWIVFLMFILAYMVWIMSYTVREFSGFDFAAITEVGLSEDAIVQSFGSVLVLPLIHLGIASFWRSQRNSAVRKKIFFIWFLVSACIGVVILFQPIYS